MAVSLNIRPISAKSETAAFDCGNPSIETRIKNAYYASLLREGYAYEIIANRQLVGYYMITLTTINGTGIPEETREYTSGVYRSLRYAAVEITFIAIDQRYQHNKIGTTVLQGVIKDIRSLSQRIPIRFIVIDALKEKVGWYKKLGFFLLNDDLSAADNCATVKMLIDCFCDKEGLEHYLADRI